MPNLSYKSHDAIVTAWGNGLTVGLLVSAPNPDGTGIVEPDTGSGYARQAVILNKVQAEGVTTLTNDLPLVFGPATAADWATVQWFGLFDAANALVLYGRLRSSRTTPAGQATTFPVSYIEIRLR